MRDEEDNRENELVRVRALRESDVAALVRIDAEHSGRARPEYYRQKVRHALENTSVQISLVAEMDPAAGERARDASPRADGTIVGFLLGSVFFGDYGELEPVATLDAIGVAEGWGRQGVATALWRQFTKNVKAMRIERVQTHVAWENWELLGFLRRLAFVPAPRLSLERRLDFEKDD